MNPKLPSYFSLAAASLGVTVALSLLPNLASAAPIASDSFAVTAGGNDYDISRLYGQNPTVGSSGFSAAWTNSLTQSTGDLAAEAGGLNASLLQGSALDGQATTAGTDTDRAVYRPFTTPPTASTSYYFSFLLNSPTGNQSYFGLSSLLSRDDLPSNGVTAGVSLANEIVLRVNSTNSVLLSSANYMVNTTYFVLVEIQNNIAGTDTINASVYSSSATDLSSPLGTIAGATGEVSSGLSHLGFFQDTSANGGLNVDEFRLGTTISDVTAVPEPSTVALLLGGFGLLVVRAVRRRVA